jgi:arylsulfatase A-like enzyme
VHATDPHSPYRPSDELAARFVRGDLRPTIDPKDPHARLRARAASMTDDDLALLRALYGAEIAYLDAEFGRLVGALRDRGLVDRTIVVFVADHGEEFRDHGGFEHGMALYQESVHVPLMIRLPGAAGRRTRTLAQHVDLMPTLLHLLGVPAPDGLPGRVLVGADGRVVDRPDAEAMTSTRFARTMLTALVVPPWKVVLSEHAGIAPQVFDLENDPGERQDVAGEHAVLVGYARQRVAEMEAAMTSARGEAQPPLDPAVRERLRRLGYVVE